MSDSANLAELPLSVLDLAPVGRGSTPADALRNSIALVQETERLGYHRHWVAEHHNMPGIASSSPAVLLAHLASVTSTIRLGSGGVMLPNHSALTVAEQFGMLEALHPGRIDLGIGRAPGTDQLTASALRRGPELLGADDFPEQMTELIGYFEGALPEGHRYERITAVPARGYKPALWLLGSSTYGASAAAVLGLPFSFAYHFAPAMLDDALEIYRRNFRPSADLDAPYVMLGVSAALRRDRRARAPTGQAGTTGVPPAPPGAPRRLPVARRGGGVQLHARGAPVRGRLDPLARRRRRRDRAIRARRARRAHRRGRAHGVDDGTHARRAGGLLHARSRRVRAQRHPLTGRSVAQSDHTVKTTQTQAIRVWDASRPRAAACARRCVDVGPVDRPA